MINIIRGLFVVLTLGFSYIFGKDYVKAKKEDNLEDVSFIKTGAIGFGTNFLDTLGIGSFAIIVSLFKLLKLNIPDKFIPGTLNVANTIPVVTQALIFTTVISVDSITLISLIASAVVGSYFGADIVSKMDERKIQLVMGIALACTATLMFLGHPSVNIIPGGGDATGLTGIKLLIGIVGNFILGALMTAGIGLYAPCMAMVYFLGMSSQVAFPIMMGSCAMLMPVASSKFIKEQAYSKKTSLAIAVCGVVGVLLAAFVVKTLETNLLKWLVIIVVIYTSITMIKAAIKSKKSEVNK